MWLWTPHRQQRKITKILHRYVGPSIITDKLWDLTYQVQLLHPPDHRHPTSTDTVHVTRMKLYQQPSNTHGATQVLPLQSIYAIETTAKPGVRDMEKRKSATGQRPGARSGL